MVPAKEPVLKNNTILHSSRVSIKSYTKQPIKKPLTEKYALLICAVFVLIIVMMVGYLILTEQVEQPKHFEHSSLKHTNSANLLNLTILI